MQENLVKSARAVLGYNFTDRTVEVEAEVNLDTGELRRLGEAPDTRVGFVNFSARLAAEPASATRLVEDVADGLYLDLPHK